MADNESGEVKAAKECIVSLTSARAACRRIIQEMVDGDLKVLTAIVSEEYWRRFEKKGDDKK